MLSLSLPVRHAASKILDCLASRTSVAYCRLVATSGSTPQKAGAVMLVFEDGSQWGTLGGGCVEAEVKRRALNVLSTGKSDVAEFQLDHDYGWDDGLICGGRMTVAMFSLTDSTHAKYFSHLDSMIHGGVGVTEAVVFADECWSGSLPTSLLFNEHNELLATLSSGTETRDVDDGGELDAIQKSLSALATRPRATVKDGIALLPILPQCRLIIIGAGHIGQAVAELAAKLDFKVTVVDDRADCAAADRFPQATELVVGPMQTTLPELEISTATYCLIVTRGHNHDQEALFHLVNRPACYLGLIGSRRKIKMIFDNLTAEGIARDSLRKVYAPIGIDIGSQTVAEIAVSVAAELVAHRNLGSIPGRPDAVPVSSR